MAEPQAATPDPEVVAHPIVRLVDGPMDGWLVTVFAPALVSTWSPSGLYVIRSRPDFDGTPVAIWKETPMQTSSRDGVFGYVSLSCHESECGRCADGPEAGPFPPEAIAPRCTHECHTPFQGRREDTAARVADGLGQPIQLVRRLMRAIDADEAD